MGFISILFYIRLLDSSLKKKEIRSCQGFVSEFQNSVDLKMIESDPIELRMQGLWIIERQLDSLPHLIQLAEFNLYKYFFTVEITFNQNPNLFRIYSSIFSSFDKLCHLWLFGLSIQIKNLPRLHSSILENVVGLLCVLKIEQINIGFNSKDNVNILGKTLIQLLEICLN